jgi:hypothetical protein
MNTSERYGPVMFEYNHSGVFLALYVSYDIVAKIFVR